MKHISAKFFLCGLISLLGCNIYGKTIFTAPDGISTNSGTISYPYDLQTARGKVVAGDTLWVRGGVYYSTGCRISVSGTAGNLIHVLAYPGETPIFDFRNQGYGSVGFQVANYTHIKGLTARYAGKNGIYVGFNCLVGNCTAYGNCDSGFQIKGGDNVIINCDSYQNFDYETMSGTSPNYGGNADGFADYKKSNRSGTTNTYIGCRSWENSDDGWDFYGVVGTSVISNCWVWSMGPKQYDMTDYPRFHDNKTDSLYAVPFKNEQGRIIIPCYGNGNGFKVGGGTTAGSTTDWAINDVTLTNCVAFGIGNTGGTSSNTSKGFDQNNNHGRMVLYNCTSYGNNRNYGFTYNVQVDSLIIINCISAYGTSGNSFSPAKQNIVYNNWNLGITVTDADFVSVDLNEIKNAVRDAEGNLPDINLFRLTSTSACIDKGIDVGLPYFGLSPDLGAFEYVPKTGIQVPATGSSAFCYPNPVFDIVYISAEYPINTGTLFSADGMYVKTVSGYGATNLSMNLSDVPEGLYFIKVVGMNNAANTLKVLKSNRKN